LGQSKSKNMIETKEQPPVMTLKQAAAYLQISKAHLSNVINGRVSGVPPIRHFPLGRRILIKREWVDEWLEQAGQGSLRSW
jgi:excisionase family DNA binding protein